MATANAKKRNLSTLLALAAVLLVPQWATAQEVVVSTVTTATVGPAAVAVGNDGTRYIAEYDGGRVLKVAADGTVSTLASLGTALYGIAVAPAGTVYVSDIFGHAVRQISAEGVVTTLAGGSRGAADGRGAAAQFYYPSGLALDAAGLLYIADRDNHRIRRIDPTTGDVTTVAGSTLGWADAQGTSAKFNTPTAVAVDLAGVIYVSDAGNARVRRIATDGTVTTLAGSTEGFADATGAAVQFATTWGVAVDAAGWVYVGDMGYANGDFYSIGAGNQRVRVISPDGVVTTLAGSGAYGFLDGPAGVAQFRQPGGLTVSSTGVVWVTDQSNHRLRQVASIAPPPTASAVTPSLGLVTGGMVVTITGSQFATGATVAVGGLPATDVTVVDDTTMTCTLPAHGAGAATVVVRNPDGQLATVPGGFLYQVPPQTLSVSKSGTGSGTVVSAAPSGAIDCGVTCAASIDHGSSVTLTATPATGSTFAGWSGGGCSGTGSCTVTMTAATAVTATFTLNSYTLTVAKSGTGSGTVVSAAPTGAIDCGVTCAASIDHGSSVTLTATPATGSTFAGWSGGGCSGTGSCTVTMTAAASITASFAMNTHPLTVSTGGTGAGTVSSSPAGIDCGSTCSAQFWSGATVTLSAMAVEGSAFGGWSGGGCSGTGTCVVTMSAATTVMATFSQAPTSLSYYLAEGSTGGQFDLDILVANPNAQPAPVVLTFLTGTGRLETLTDTLPAISRRTYRIGRDHVPALADEGGISTVVESTAGLPLVVERTMFWDKTTGYAGHGGTAVARPETTWYFGEGAQGFFDTFVLLANAGDIDAQVTVRFLLDDPAAPPVEVPVTVGAKRRETLWALAYPALVGRSFSIVAESDVPIMAERAMYFGERFVWPGGHESAGVPALSTQWFHAEGATGPTFDEYILVGNPNETETTLTFTFLLDTGAPIVGRKVVAPRSRFTLNMEAAGPLLDGVSPEDDARLQGAAISVRVEATQPVVSERAMYWPGDFTTWAEAHNSFGVTEAGVKWGLAEGRRGGPLAFDTYILIANPSDQDAQVTVTFLPPDGSAVAPLTRTVTRNSRFNIHPFEMPEGEFGAVIESTNGVPIVVERAMYWTPPGGPFWDGGTNALATKLQ